MFSLGKHFEDGPLIPALVADAYRYFARLARDFGKPAHVWLFDRYPTYSFYQFDQPAVIALYSNTSAKKELPAFEITADGFLGTFLAADMDDLKKECRKRAPQDLEVEERIGPTETQRVSLEARMSASVTPEPRSVSTRTTAAPSSTKRRPTASPIPPPPPVTRATRPAIRAAMGALGEALRRG